MLYVLTEAYRTDLGMNRREKSMTFLENLIKDESTVKQFEREYYLNIKPEKLVELEPVKPAFCFGALPIKGGR